MPAVTSRNHLAWRVLAVVAVLALAATACSKSSNNSSGTTATTVTVQKFRFSGMPSTMSSGIHEFLFENRESFSITHEMIPIALPSGKTVQDVINAAKAPGEAGPASEDEWLHIGGDFGPADTNASVVEWLYLPPGKYAIACWQTGVANQPTKTGPPHAAKGMVFGFTVT